MPDTPRVNWSDPPELGQVITHTYAANKRDVGNEQQAPLAPLQVDAGAWRRIDEHPSAQILYASLHPFTARIEWSDDGINPLAAPFTGSTLQQRVTSGYNVAYYVTSGNAVAAWYRLVITNGPTAQLPYPGFISLNWLVNHPYQGTYVFLDEVLGMLSKAHLTRAVLSAGKGVNNWPAVQFGQALRADSLPMALDTESAAVLANILTALTGLVVSGAVSVTNFPANQVISGTVNVANFPAPTPMLTAGGSFTNLLLPGTVVVKNAPGVLERVIINKISSAGVVTLALHNGLTVAAPKIASIQIGATAPGSSGVIAPASLGYFAAFSTGLTAQLVGTLADVTLVWR